ncbi:preprotein translocase subunit YajC [Candidatus Pacearchaeota archaeon]|nr:preprotein translocase subunit YajC [Candidatus Pacearchaeota archaeon]
MASRKKRLKKQIEGLIRQAEKHEAKAETEEGKKDTTPDYWLGEAERFRKRAKERKEMLEKLEKKDKN